MDASQTEIWSQRPVQILNRAEVYSKTLQNFYEMPKNISKSLVVQSKAQYETDFVRYAIKTSKYQQNIYKSKESNDLKERKQFQQKILSKDEKAEKNIKQIDKKRTTLADNFNKHLKQVGRRYSQSEQHKQTRQKQESNKLKQELIQFFQKEKQRKKAQQKRQVSVASCYADAVERINQIHKKNQEYSQTSRIHLDQRLATSNKFSERISHKRRTLSAKNKAKQEVFCQGLNIFMDKNHHFIQKYGRNEDGSIRAWSKIGKTITDWRKKREEENKRNLQKWKQGKRQADQAKSHISDRCINIIDKTSKASFRQTASSFRATARQFEDTVEMNKANIRQNDEKKREQIMDIHLDLRLRNRASVKISQKMLSMRQHAGKIAYDFL